MGGLFFGLSEYLKLIAIDITANIFEHDHFSFLN